MNKRNFVYKYLMEKSDFDHLQNDVESGLNRLGETIAGKGSGLDVTLSVSTATISSGTAFDDNGKRIGLAHSTTVDASNVVRPAANNIKWATLVIKHAYKKEGSVTDGKNRAWAERLIDHYATELLEGSEGTEKTAAKPAISAEQVPLVDIKVDHSTSWASLETDTGRRAHGRFFRPIKDFIADYLDMTPLWTGTKVGDGKVKIGEDFNHFHFLLARIAFDESDNNRNNCRVGYAIIPTSKIIVCDSETNSSNKTVALGEDLATIRFSTTTTAYYAEKRDNALLGICGLGRKR